MAGSEERFAALVAALDGRTGVTGPDPTSRRFGSDALKVDGSIFAMVTNDQLVLKLPRERVSTLIETGGGAPFGAGRGRPMKEWVAIGEGSPGDDLLLAEEALAFVGGPGSGPGCESG